MKHQTISLCMIVKNEEVFLKRCLDSVRNIVDEIIIVDTGSTDATLDIARVYEAKIYHFEWIGDFAVARNEALKHATSDYILVLDADEYLENDHHLLLEKLEHEIYYLRIKSFLQGGISTIHPIVRLFKKRDDLKFVGRIHEQILLPDDGVSTYGHIDLIINHDGYLKEVVTTKDKIGRNLDLLLRENKENETGFSLFNLGMHYKLMGEFNKAIDAFQKAYPLSVEFSFLSKLLASLIQCLVELKQYREALIICKDAVLAYPKYTDLYFIQGQIYEGLNYFHDAELSFKKCLSVGEVTDTEVMTFHGVGSYMATTALASLYQKKRMNTKALELCITALQENPKYLPALHVLLDLMKNFSIEDALHVVNNVYRINHVEDLKLMIGVLYKLRHPLLRHYVEMFDGEVDNDFKVIMSLYGGQFNQAQDYWLEDKSIVNTELTKDVLLLAIILRDVTLLDKYKHLYSYRQKDWKVLYQIVRGEQLKEQKWSKDMEVTLLSIFDNLLLLKQFEIIEYFIVNVNSYYLAFSFAEKMSEYGFNDIALSIMDSHIESVNRAGLVWIADLLCEEGNVEEGLNFYQRALNEKETFDVYEKCYVIYNDKNDHLNANRMLESLVMLDSNSDWASDLLAKRAARSRLLRK